MSATYAQRTEKVRVKIPLAFEMPNKTLPAGEYSFYQTIGTPASWLVRNRIESSASYLLPVMYPNRNDKNKFVVTFRRYRDRYFLAAFTTADFKFVLPKSKRERQLLRWLESKNKIAKAEIVIIEIAAE